MKGNAKYLIWLLVYVVVAAGLLTWNLSGMDEGHGGEHGEESEEHGEEHGEEGEEHGEEEHEEEEEHGAYIYADKFLA